VRILLCMRSLPCCAVLSQYPEFGLQAVLTALMVFSGRWLVGGLHVAVLAYNLRLVFLQQHRVDVTGATHMLFGAAPCPSCICRCHGHNMNMRGVLCTATIGTCMTRCSISAAEVFREIGREKKIRMIKLGLYVLIFVVVIYKCVLTQVQHADDILQMRLPTCIAFCCDSCDVEPRNIVVCVQAFKVYLCIFCRLVETAVHTLLTAEGRVHAATLMKQAAAEM
jgi:Cornichon protein